MAVFFAAKRGALFNIPVEKQKGFLEKLPEPKNDWERSFYQYKCQMFLKGRIFAIILNIISMFAYLPLYLLYKRKSLNKSGRQINNIFLNHGLSIDTVPKELQDELNEIKTVTLGDIIYISEEDKDFLKEIRKKYPFSWHFHLKLLIKVAQYRSLIDEYRPKVMIVCSEYSFTSSILTDYLSRKGIEHINVQHGENFYFIERSFFRFHRCYLWNQRYVDLFAALRAEQKQFRIAIPRSLKFDTQLSVSKEYDYTYYLGYNPKWQLKLIHENLLELQNKGMKISVRPHPRYSNNKYVKEIFHDMNIEMPREVDIKLSVLRTKHAVSLYSVVLQQAYENNVKVVIDDVTDSKKYLKIKELEYSLLETEHQLLSELT